MDSGSADFGTLLKQHRLASGVTQERLAEQARISVAAVGSLERGIRRAPHRDTVALLAEALRLAGPEKAGFETAAEHARARRARADPTGPAHGNLPTRLTIFVGRDNEIAEIEALLKLHRLVTITGSGGVGKTLNLALVPRSHLVCRSKVMHERLRKYRDPPRRGQPHRC
jgi:transcriptional regulator with XRE-family HTH domain